MILGARTVPLPLGSRQQMAALQPNTGMLRRRLGASRRQAFKDWAWKDPVPDPRCLLLKCSQTNSAHTFWFTVVSVSSSIVLFVRASSENSFSRD